MCAKYGEYSTSSVVQSSRLYDCAGLAGRDVAASGAESNVPVVLDRPESPGQLPALQMGADRSLLFSAPRALAPSRTHSRGLNICTVRSCSSTARRSPRATAVRCHSCALIALSITCLRCAASANVEWNSNPRDSCIIQCTVHTYSRWRRWRSGEPEQSEEAPWVAMQNKLHLTSRDWSTRYGVCKIRAGARTLPPAAPPLLSSTVCPPPVARRKRAQLRPRERRRVAHRSWRSLPPRLRRDEPGGHLVGCPVRRPPARQSHPLPVLLSACRDVCRQQESDLIDVNASALHDWLGFVLSRLYGKKFWLGAQPAPDRSVRARAHQHCTWLRPDPPRLGACCTSGVCTRARRWTRRARRAGPGGCPGSPLRSARGTNTRHPSTTCKSRTVCEPCLWYERFYTTIQYSTAPNPSPP